MLNRLTILALFFYVNSAVAQTEVIEFIRAGPELDKQGEAACLSHAREFSSGWQSVVWQLPTEKAAADVVHKLSSVKGPSCSLFRPALELLVYLNAKNWLAEGELLLRWMERAYSKPPPSLNEAANAVADIDEKLKVSVPNPVDFRDRVALIVYKWMSPKTVAKMEQVTRERLYLALLESLHHAGRTKWNATLVKMLSDEDLRKNLKWSAQVSEQLCVNLRDTGKVDECDAWIAKLEKMAAEAKIELPSLLQEHARIHMERGQLPQARELYLKIVADPKRYLSAPHMLPWVYFDLAMLEALDDRYVESERYLNEHTRLLESASPGGISAWDQIPRRIMRARLLIYTGKFAEAREQLDLVEEITKKNIRGMNATLIRAKFYRLLISAAERDVKSATRSAQELRSMIEICPDPQVLIPWSKALEKAARGQYAEKDLEPMKKVIGPHSGRVRDIQYVMALVVNQKPAAKIQ